MPETSPRGMFRSDAKISLAEPITPSYLLSGATPALEP